MRYQKLRANRYDAIGGLVNLLGKQRGAVSLSFEIVSPGFAGRAGSLRSKPSLRHSLTVGLRRSSKVMTSA